MNQKSVLRPKYFTRSDVGQIKAKARIGRSQVVEILNNLTEERGGVVTPRDVVDEARKDTSPIHHLFEWDDSKAAEKYRLATARILLTTVKVTYEGKQEDAFFNATVTIDDGTKMRGYFPIKTVLSNEELHLQVLQEAVRELDFAQKKYEHLKELEGVIDTKKLSRIKAQVLK